MRSSVRTLVVLSIALAAVAAASVRVSAQSGAAGRYKRLVEEEARVSRSPDATAEDIRRIVNQYWELVRRYPSSGYADNALWQAAGLSAYAFDRFTEDRDRHRAVQLFQWLYDQYPHSPLRTKARAQLDLLGDGDVVAPQVAGPAASQDPGEVIIRSVQREVLPEIVRVTVELEREVQFRQEKIDGPARLFFDLSGTKAAPSLLDATFRYDSDVVRHIRFGRHPNNTTRIVLDLENVRRYSVFTLYNPYRIVIDAERSAAAQALYAAANPAPARTEPTLAPARPIAPSKPATAPAVAARPDTSASRANGDVETPGTVDASLARPAAPAPRTPAPAKGTKDPRTTQIAPTVVSPAKIARSTPAAPLSSPAETATGTATPVSGGKDAPSTAAASSAEAERPSGPGKPLTPSANSSGKFSVARQLGLGVSRVVIDPGHGGHDPGATAFGLSEAELVLDIAQRLEKLLIQQPGMEVELTRRTDQFVPLEERTEIANRESADLFLSIHANASTRRAARGVETYFLNFALNPQAEAVAARENAASGKTMASLPSIIRAITLNNKLNESREFAESVQRSLVRGLRPSNRSLKDLGVKQAPFMVLIGASMPSVLAEISFVTNSQEARLLKTPAYRQKIAESLLAGILRYQQSLKKVQSAALK